MNSYKFDWQNTLTGTIELEAENGTLAEEKLMTMTLKELLEKSKYVSDDKGRSIRFVDLDGNNFSDSLDEQDWYEHKSVLQIDMKFLGYVFGAKGATIHHEQLYENIYSTYLFQAFAQLVVLSLSYTIYAKFLSPKNKKSDTASLVVPILFTFSLILVWYTRDLDRNDPKVSSYFASGKGESYGKGIDCKITSLKLNGSYSQTKPIMFWFNNRKVTKVDRWVPENKYNKKYGFRYTSTADYLNFNQRDNLNNEVCFTLDRKNLQLTGKKLVYNEGKNKYI